MKHLHGHIVSSLQYLLSASCPGWYTGKRASSSGYTHVQLRVGMQFRTSKGGGLSA